MLTIVNTNRGLVSPIKYHYYRLLQLSPLARFSAILKGWRILYIFHTINS